MQGKRYDELEYAEANSIRRYCVCSQCWGPLKVDFERGATRKKYKVYCEKCGEGRGFVSREYADRRKAEDANDARDARRNLEEALGMKSEKKSVEEISKLLYGS